MTKAEPAAPAGPEPGQFAGMPFDQFERYRICAELAGAMARTIGPGERPLSALDVGGHHRDFWGAPHRPIAEALPGWRTITVDLVPSPLSGYVRASGHRLPFADRAFDFVASVDVLEHVAPDARDAVLAEAGRVCGRVLVIAAPFRDSRIERAERLVSEFIENTCGYVQGQLAEHRTFGLPAMEATCAALELQGWTLRVFPYGNLWRWIVMMIDKHSLAALAGGRPVHLALDDDFNATRFATDRELPCYRHFIVAARDPGDPLLQLAGERYGATLPDQQVSPPEGAADELFFELATLHARNQEIQVRGEPLRRDTHVAEIEAEKRTLHEHLDMLKRSVAQLEQQLRDVEASPTFRVARLLRRLVPVRSRSST